MDRWPYETESAEAVFAREFVHPQNGPLPSDPRRPPYRENVYSFTYGPVRAIVYNNKYWYSSASSSYGGAPEGYLLEDQLAWLLAEIDRAEKDPDIRFVVLTAQEPPFPNGGHLGDAMWHGGNDTVRAHVFRDGKLTAGKEGVITMRNRLVRAIGASRKVAAVLAGDEHAYHRTLIGPGVAAGDPARDDKDRNGRIEAKAGETPGPLNGLRFNTWYIVSGGGGAPYHSEEPTPWSGSWKDRAPLPSGAAGFRHSSQEHFLLFETKGSAFSLKVINLHGETFDEIPDLLRDKPVTPRGF